LRINASGGSASLPRSAARPRLDVVLLLTVVLVLLALVADAGRILGGVVFGFLHVATPADPVGLLRYPVATSLIRQPLLDVLRRDDGDDLQSLPGRVVCSDLEMVVRVVTATPQVFTDGPLFAYAPELPSGALAIVDVNLPFAHKACMHTNADAYPLPAVNKARQIIRELLDEMRATIS
jgi:hypothetical protein